MTATQKLDSQINHYLSHLSDKKKKAVLTIVKTFAEVDNAEYWNQMPDEVKQSISKGLQQADAGIGKPHQEVMKKYKKWLGK